MNQIREADIQDFSGIYHLVCLLEETQFDKDAMYEVFLHTLNNNTVFVSCENNIITGYLVLSITYQMHHCGKVAEIIELCVDDPYHNRKIGTALLQKAQEYAIQQGCVNMDIKTNQKRKDAHRFYARNGFINTHYTFTKVIKKS